MIKSIRLLNWRSHADTRLEFRKGTNLLVGIMGAGKSSIIEGISFALYGTFPAMERRKIKLENVVRLSEGTASVTLEFEWDGAIYRVERGIERSKKGTSSQAELFRDDSLIEHGQVAVTKHVQSLTGVDYDLFTRAIYSEQNNIDHFLNLDPRKRKEELDALLGLDRFETARSNAITLINRMRAKREGIEQRFSRERLAELAKKEAEASAEAMRLGQALNAALSLAATLASGHTEASERFERLKKTRDAFERLEKDGMKLSMLAESLSKELEGVSFDESKIRLAEEALPSLSETNSRLQRSLKEAEARALACSREGGLLEAKSRQAQENSQRLAALRAELAALLGTRTGASLSEAQKSLQEKALGAESEAMSLKSQMAEINDAVAKLKPGMSECPVCSSPLPADGVAHVKAEKARLLIEKNARRAELEALASGLKKESDSLAKLLRQAEALEERITTLAKEPADVSSLSKARAELESRSKAAEEERRRLGEEALAAVTAAEKAKAELTALRLLQSKARLLEDARRSLSQNKAESSSIEFSSEEFEKSRAEAEKLLIESEKAKSEARSLQLQLKLSSDALGSLRAELALLRGMEADVRELYGIEEQLSVFKNALSDTQAGLRSSLSEAINGAMNEVWSIFYPYRNYHGLRLLASDRDYLFEVNDGAGWKSLESVASGGERACAALALRMSLAMVLTPKLSWLILDEPTHNLDSEAVEMLSHALQFKVPEVVRQTFVITHDEAFMGSDFASSFRISREKDQNGPSRAEPA